MSKDQHFSNPDYHLYHPYPPSPIQMSENQHFSNPDYCLHHPYPSSPIQSNSSKSLHGSPTPVPNNPPKSPHGSSSKCNPSNVTKSPSALREVIIGKKSGISMMIPLKLDGAELEALVDSGSQPL